jgi:predicted deacylase
VASSRSADAGFDPVRLPEKTASAQWLDVPNPEGNEPLRVPLLAARGSSPGRTLVVLGGVHGDEYEGVVAARRTFEQVAPSDLAGTLLVVPVCNPPALFACSRTSPIDGANLARVFPGRPDGSHSERLAHVLHRDVISHGDFIIDLHSSGSRISMPLLVGFYGGEGEAGRSSREAALRFGIPTVWAHWDGGLGRSISEPHTRGIPWLYTESPSGGWLHHDVAELYANGVLRVMRFLGMLAGEAPVAEIALELAGEGDIDESLVAPVAGLLLPHVELLERVRRNALLGVVHGLDGERLGEIRAPSNGIVVLRRETPPVAAGDIVFLLT